MIPTPRGEQRSVAVGLNQLDFLAADDFAYAREAHAVKGARNPAHPSLPNGKEQAVVFAAVKRQGKVVPSVRA